MELEPSLDALMINAEIECASALEAEKALALDGKKAFSGLSDGAIVLTSIKRADGDRAIRTHDLYSDILRLWMEVEQHTGRPESLVDLSQDVHDALDGQSSQGVREYGDVETVARIPESRRISNVELNAAQQLWRHRFACSEHVAFKRIESEYRLRRLSDPPGQPAITSPDLENRSGLEVHQLCEGTRLCAFRIYRCHRYFVV